MESLNTVDYIIFSIAMIGGIWGAIKGLISEVSRKFGYIAGLILALMFTQSLANLFVDKLQFPNWFALGSAYVLIFICGYLLCVGLGQIISKVLETIKLDAIDNILGFVLGVFEAILVIGILEMLLSAQNFWDVKPYFDASLFSEKIIMPFVNWISSVVQKVL